MNDVNRAPLSHDEVQELLPGYVLGSLDPDEMLAVDDYLQEHPELWSRVQEMDDTAAQLAYAAPPAPLPAHLQEQVMARARATLPLEQPPIVQAAVRPTAAAPMPRAVPSATRPAIPAAAKPTWWDALRIWWRARGLIDLSLAGSALALLVLSIALGQAVTRIDGLQRQVSALQAESTALREQNVLLEEALQERLNQLASLAGATQLVALAGTEAAPNAAGTLYVRDTQATLVLRDLQELNAEQTYQLWLIPADGAPVPAGLLGQARGGVATISLGLPASLTGIAAVGVSIEPPGGSPAPTGPIVLLGQT